MLASPPRQPWTELTRCVTLLILIGIGWNGPTRSDAGQPAMRVYFGTYTNGESQGIYVSDFDPDTGKLGMPRLAAETANPSFLALHPNRRFLYAVNELGRFRGKASGALTSLAIQPDGSLRQLNQVPTRGGAPCHLEVDRHGKHVYVANYSGGNICSLPIAADGSVGTATGFVQHAGSSVTSRQKGPHAHGIHLDPQQKFAAVADLGLDKVLVYALDHQTGNLTPADPPAADVRPGAGPRHLAFRPDGAFLYSLNELDSTVTAFRYSPEVGTLSTIQTISTLPKDYAGKSYTSEVLTSPDGKTLYCSNRGHDSIAVFRIDATSGELELVELESTQGKTPRGFGIDPRGNYLLVGNQGSHTVTVLKIDTTTGGLTPTGQQLQVPTPVCVVFQKL